MPCPAYDSCELNSVRLFLIATSDGCEEEKIDYKNIKKVNYLNEK